MTVTLNPSEPGLRLGFALRACLTLNPKPSAGSGAEELESPRCGASFLGFKGCSSSFAERKKKHLCTA